MRDSVLPSQLSHSSQESLGSDQAPKPEKQALKAVRPGRCELAKAQRSARLPTSPVRTFSVFPCPPTMLMCWAQGSGSNDLVSPPRFACVQTPIFVSATENKMSRVIPLTSHMAESIVI